MSLRSDGVDGVEGTAWQREVSVEVATKYCFNKTLGNRLQICVDRVKRS